jgi:hypothetical protein
VHRLHVGQAVLHDRSKSVTFAVFCLFIHSDSLFVPRIEPVEVHGWVLPQGSTGKPFKKRPATELIRFWPSVDALDQSHMSVQTVRNELQYPKLISYSCCLIQTRPMFTPAICARRSPKAAEVTSDSVEFPTASAYCATSHPRPCLHPLRSRPLLLLPC